MDGRQSIIRHPLFPVTIALWFGALFGLGSLAIRPGLLESVVVSLGIDAIVPAAAPPLGLTARILFALFMAGLGGVIGAMLGRVIARPKPVVRERKRGANGANTTREPAQDASTSPNLLGKFGFGQKAEEPAPRRRAQLAMAEDADPRYYAESAPLPGGSPQILDVSEFDLDGFEEPEHFFEAREDQAPAPLAATASDQSMPAAEMPEGAQVFQPEPEPALEPAHDDTVDQAPFQRRFDERPAEEPPFSISRADQSQCEEPRLGEPAQRIDAPEPPAFAPPAAEFGELPASPAQPSAELPASSPEASAQNGGDPFAFPFADDDEAAPAFPDGPPAEKLPFTLTGTGRGEIETRSEKGSAPGFSLLPRMNGSDESETMDKIGTNVFNQPAAEPLFARPQASRNPADQRETGADGLPKQGSAAPFANPQPTEPQPVPQEEHASLPRFDAPAEATQAAPAVEAPAQPAGTPETAEGEASAAVTSKRIETAELGELSQVELLERLALSLKKQREAMAPPQGVATAMIEAPEPEAAQPRDAAPAGAAAQEPAFAPRPFEPASFKPEAPSFSTNLADPAPPAEADFAPAPASIPAALRPIGFDEEEDDHALPPLHVPPRRIGTAETGIPSGLEETGAEQSETVAAPFEPAGATEADQRPAIPTGFGEGKSNENEDDDLLEDGYSSLLNLSRNSEARQHFVRIDEPDTHHGEIEPVVVFPGQGSAQPGPFSRPVPAAPEAPAEQVTPVPPVPTSSSEPRHFDAPDEAEAAGSPPAPLPAAPAAARQDPEETERALKSALATLQRMSGAA